MTLSVYIGYDPREHDAYEVCAHSIDRHATVPSRIKALEQDALRRSNLYSRPFETRKDGQRYDLRDGRPFSTEFSFSRFLVPMLELHDGWALFCDCDFLFTANVYGLMEYADPKYAALVVKHNHVPRETMKMDGQIQSAYPRKNWSSFILWNCSHPAHRELSVHDVNHRDGSWLHGFSWLSDDLIGELPPTWNWLAGVSEPLGRLPNAIHFTLGIPSMKGHENAPYAQLWRHELSLAGAGRPSHRIFTRAAA